MARIKRAMMTRKRRKKTLKMAKGYFGAKSKRFKMAKQAVMKSGNYAYIGRKQKKRDFRRLWITRISAACKLNGMNYSQFMNGLKKAGIFHLVGIADIEVVGRFVSQFLIFVFVVFFAHVFFRVSMGQKYAFSSKQKTSLRSNDRRLVVMRLSYRAGNLHFLYRSLRGSEAGDGHAERAAGDIVQADLMAELDGGGVAAMLAADAELEVRTGLSAGF